LSTRSRSKSERRRSPEPLVVRAAAFVSPIPNRSVSNCSSGRSSLGVRPASASNRQKSFRGLAKCAPASADTKPGLIPQKTTRRRGASTSGTSLGAARPELRPRRTGPPPTERLRPAPLLTADRDPGTQTVPRIQLHDPDHGVARAVAAEVALLLAQRPQPSHDRSLRSPPDRTSHAAYPRSNGSTGHFRRTHEQSPC